jgi:hypothetical protein
MQQRVRRRRARARGDDVPNAAQKARAWLFELFVHAQNENSRINRAAAAKGFGLDPERYSSLYPGSQVTINNPASNGQVAVPAAPGSVTVGSNGGSNFVQGALLAAAMLAGGALTTLAVTGGLKGTTSAPAAPVTTPAPSPVSPTPALPVVPTKPNAYDAVYERQQPDGTWKEYKREHLQ